MSGDLRARIVEHVDVFEKCGKQQSAAFLREINERLAQLEQENAKLREDRDEIISMRDAAESHVIRLRQENAKLRESLAVAERLCLASSHLLKGAESIYDPRGDVGPTHWMGTCDKLIAELDRVVGKYA